MTSHAVRLDVAEATATVVSADKAVTDWTGRYFGQWWNATEVPAQDVCTGSVVIATVDQDRYDAVALRVTQEPHSSTQYARAQLLLSREVSSGAVRAVSPEQQLAYVSEPGRGRLEILGVDSEAVATATARLAREVVRGLLLRNGWAVLHASAVVAPDGRTVLTLGQKGAGKTTTALALAAHQGFRLLANDRVFVRPGRDSSEVEVLPWPAAAAVGLGLLEALGWFDVARERLARGEQLHPTQHERVTAAIRAGVCEPLWNGDRELKAQVFPDQFEGWFGVPLATVGTAAALVYPSIEKGAAPAEGTTVRWLAPGDFMSGSTEDRYPDVFGLLGVDGGGADGVKQEVTRRLGRLPQLPVVLGHDVAANGEFLAKLIG
ncbi:hypothetical protein [Streptomyces sp. enrichment culture]|uniref:hypothetical protein n=1 Tax=Streptomyces sp. enrichment culture TaxID=1795815 RepID=UPI003F558586